MIQDRIKNNIEYFRGIDIQGGLYIVKVQYKPKWSAYPSQDGLIKVAKSDTAVDEFFYYANIEEVELDRIFDLIESTISMNVEANLKVQLMLQKIEELKEIFGNNNLSKLETLYFGFSEPATIPLKTKRKYKKKNKEIEEVVNETTDNSENKEEEVKIEESND